MESNLKARLMRIRKTGGLNEYSEAGRRTPDGRQVHGLEESPAGQTGINSSAYPSSLLKTGWLEAGFKTMKRTITLTLDLPLKFEEKLGILIPDLRLIPAGTIHESSLVFFDLETTGLSTGSGTVAFLAALGRVSFERVQKRIGEEEQQVLCITQYLLLDYSGESDFLDAILNELQNPDGPVLMVSYNGKSFDAQILRTRCLINGKTVPEFFHADLLYPSRRLWKSKLPNCSQAEIERSVLGIKRIDDIHGSLAPDIWFEFLRTGKTSSLTGIAEHNEKDIQGLATLFSALGHIVRNPLANIERFNFDLGALALRFKETGMETSFQASSPSSLTPSLSSREEIEMLLYAAAERQYPQAMYVLGKELLYTKDAERGRLMLQRLVRQEGVAPGVSPENVIQNCPTSLRGAANLVGAACRILAIDAERRLRDIEKARDYVRLGLDLDYHSTWLREDFLKRQKRLL